MYCLNLIARHFKVQNRIFLSVFIQPPSVEELRKRLIGRGTDAPEVIESRVAKAEYELGFAPKFDTVIVNDDLETAKAEALKVITQFLNR